MMPGPNERPYVTDATQHFGNSAAFLCVVVYYRSVVGPPGNALTTQRPESCPQDWLRKSASTRG